VLLLYDALALRVTGENVTPPLKVTFVPWVFVLFPCGYVVQLAGLFHAGRVECMVPEDPSEWIDDDRHCSALRGRPSHPTYLR
jgi:hypothetical protein